MTNLSSLVPRTWAHLFPTASTASLPARDTQAATTVSARAHATANCKHHLLSQALFEPAVVSCRPAIWTGQLLLEGETFEVTARLSAAVCSLGPARTNLALEPLPVSESAGASSASLIPDHHIERASRRGARVVVRMLRRGALASPGIDIGLGAEKRRAQPVELQPGYPSETPPELPSLVTCPLPLNPMKRGRFPHG
jgi:hypothetical protein